MIAVPPIPLRRNRDFTLLWIGQSVSTFGSELSALAYPLLVLGLTGSPVKAGIVGFAATLPLFLFSLPAGVVVDRINRKRVMIVCDAGRLLAVLSLPLALWADVLRFEQIVLVAFVEGALLVFFDLAETAALRNVVPGPQMSSAVAANQARFGAATLIGPPVGGVLFGVGRALPFVADAVSYLVSLVAVLLVRSSLQEERERAETRFIAEAVEGILWLWRQPFLRATSLLVAGNNVIGAGVYLLLILLAREKGASPGEIGVMIAMFGGAGVLGAIVAVPLSRRVSPLIVVAGVNWVWLGVIPLLAFAPNPLLLGVLGGLLQFVFPTWNAVVVSRRLALTPDRLVGRVQSGHRLLGGGAVPLGPLLAGVLFEATGGGATVFAFAAVVAVLALASTFSPAVRAEAAAA